MRRHGRGGGGEPEAGTTVPAGRTSSERLEQPVAQLHRHPRAAIQDIDPKGASPGAGGVRQVDDDLDLRARLGLEHCVVQQVSDRLLDTNAVDADHSFRGARDHPHVARFRDGCEPVDQAVNQIPDWHRLSQQLSPG